MVRACRECQGHHYARFHDSRYHRYKERHFSILLDVKMLTDGWTNGRKVELR